MGDFGYLFFMAVMALCVGWGGYKLIVMGKTAVFAGFLIGVAAIALFFGFKARQSQSWDAIGHFAFLLVFVMPALTGLVAGGIAGFVKRRRDA